MSIIDRLSSYSVMHNKQVKGLVCTELMDVSFSGWSDQTGLAGWGASVCQPFINRSEQRQVQLDRQQQQQSFLHTQELLCNISFLCH